MVLLNVGFRLTPGSQTPSMMIRFLMTQARRSVSYSNCAGE